jgi:hypothetical protein
MNGNFLTLDEFNDAKIEPAFAVRTCEDCRAASGVDVGRLARSSDPQSNAARQCDPRLCGGVRSRRVPFAVCTLNSNRGIGRGQVSKPRRSSAL